MNAITIFSYLAIGLGLTPANPNPQELIEKIRKEWTPLESYTMAADVHMVFADSENNEALSRTNNVTYRRDNEDMQVFGKSTLYRDSEIDKGQSRDFVTVLADGNDIRATRDFGKESFNGSFGPSKEKLIEAFEGHPTYGAFIEGRIHGIGDNESIAQILGKNLEIHPNREIVNKQSCYVLEEHTKYGLVKLWVAPDLGNNVLKYSIQKTGDALILGKPIKDSNLEEYEVVVTLDKLELIDGQLIAHQGEFKKYIKYKGGREKTSTISVERKDIVLNPDFDLINAFDPEIPEGTMMTNRSFDAVQFQWINGKPQLFVDDMIVEELDGVARHISHEYLGSDNKIMSNDAEKGSSETSIPIASNNAETDIIGKQASKPNSTPKLIASLGAALSLCAFCVCYAKRKCRNDP